VNQPSGFLALKEQGTFYWISKKLDLLIFILGGSFFQIGNNHKGQVKSSLSTQYMSVFIKSFKVFVCRDLPLYLKL